MRLETDYRPLEGHIRDAFDGATRDTLERFRAQARRRTGRYASSLRLEGSFPKVTIGSDLPQAAAMRFGANVGPRRGPHHGPVDTLDVGRTYGERMGERLRG